MISKQTRALWTVPEGGQICNYMRSFWVKCKCNCFAKDFTDSNENNIFVLQLNNIVDFEYLYAKGKDI